MNETKITAIIPVRKISQTKKKILSFFDNKSLLEIKINQLKEIKFIDNIVKVLIQL